MFKITVELKKYAVANLGVAQDANDDTVKAAVSKALEDGKITLKQVAELTEVQANEGEKRVRAIVVEEVGKAVSPLADSIKSLGELITKNAKGGDGASTTLATAATAATSTQPVENKTAANTDNLGTKAYTAAAAASTQSGGQAATFTNEYEQVRIRVKSVAERYDDTKTLATWDKSPKEYLRESFGGMPINANFSGDGMYDIHMPTSRSKKIAGAWFKHLLAKSCKSQGQQVPNAFTMSEEERDLCKYTAHECRFVGPIGYKGGEGDSHHADHWFDAEKATKDWQIKALLDDSTSGGLEAVPIEFDAAVILTPLLSGELFPFVNVRQVSRRRIEGWKLGTPTMSWGTNSGTPISLFDTDSFISAFDNNIYPITGALEVGLDFLADTPVSDMGGLIVDEYGKRFRAEMDSVIAEGNGTSQPEGIFTTSGTVTVNAAGGAGTAPQVGDYEAHMFGVNKAFREEAGRPPNSRAVFIGTDTSYRRARAIAVNTAAPTTDARRMFGQGFFGVGPGYMDYQVNGYRWAVVESLTNAQVAFACLNRYRLYRRQGLEVMWVPMDRTGALRQTRVVVVRARFGGAIELATAATVQTDAQA